MSPKMPLKPQLPLPDLLRPQIKMRPNEACWCGSGAKWKFCHKDRTTSEGENAFKFTASMNKYFRQGTCLHPNAPSECSSGVIKSHTVQKAGVLSHLAENGHVMSARGVSSNMHKTNGKFLPQLVGIRQASTFPGFCSKHDTELFRPIENDEFNENTSTAFLFTFRAIAYEFHSKQMAIKSVEQLKRADAGRTLLAQFQIQNLVNDALYGMRIAMEELIAWKLDLDRQFQIGDFSDYRMSTTYFDGIVPVAASAAFDPEFDFSGLRLQSLLDSTLERVILSIVIDKGRSVACFVWRGSPSGEAERFVRSFENLDPSEKAAALITLCFVHTENWHADPRWWKTLSEDDIKVVSRLMKLGAPTPDGQRSSTSLTPPAFLRTLSVRALHSTRI